MVENQKVRGMVLAYRIWCHCTPRGWDCTFAEVAEALNDLDVSAASVSNCARSKGWTNRFRVLTRDSARLPLGNAGSFGLGGPDTYYHPSEAAAAQISAQVA